MASGAKRLFQNWELDIAEAKQKFENRVRTELNALERRVLKSSGLEVIDDEPVELNEDLNSRKRSTSTSSRSSAGRQAGESDDAESAADSDADSTAPGVNRTIVIDKTREKPPELPRRVIGTINIRVKSMLAEKFGDTKAYFEIQVEDEKFRSPVAFKQAGKAFVWEIGGHFDITDITNGFTVTVWSKNLLKTSDRLLGRVWIPYTKYDAKVDEDGKVETIGAANYALFPLRAKSVRAVPGHRRAMETAMDKKEFLDNLVLTVEHSLTLDKAYLHGGHIWPLYFVNAGYMHLAPQRKASPLKSLANSPQAILESVSDLKRNAARISSAINAISESVPMAVASYVLSWENPVVSVAAALASLAFARFVTAPALPLVLFALFALSCLIARKPPRSKRSSWALWNDEIDLDPELSLTSLQRYARVVQKIEDIAKMLNNVACVFEKLINLSNFADPNATMAVMLVLLAASGLLSFAIFVSRALHFSFPGLCMFAAIVGPLFVRSESSRERVSGLDVALTGVYNRIPSNDDVGARWVSEQQRHFPEEKAREAEAEAQEALKADEGKAMESKPAEKEKAAEGKPAEALDVVETKSTSSGTSLSESDETSSLRKRFSSNRTIME